MASPPPPAGFASRRLESPWLPPRVTSVAAANQLHRCGQESRPGKEFDWRRHHYLALDYTSRSALAPQMGGNSDDKAVVMQIMMFLTGINTLLQSFFGTRLPAVIGGSYTFVLPTISIILAGHYTNEPDLHTICWKEGIPQNHAWNTRYRKAFRFSL